ncbi:Hypothetical protein SMAX5B_015583 [Scophthalmus maximus]|uniref:Uncharacterized protein n=1 Tax=Scophthalmus maximus TaxID=52904 RepID=A0A2U9CYJ5_SCOMX|nr:Hypothetical protein SMAX5B_015583 [Scophthalmus maximus]
MDVSRYWVVELLLRRLLALTSYSGSLVSVCLMRQGEQVCQHKPTLTVVLLFHYDLLKLSHISNWNRKLDAQGFCETVVEMLWLETVFHNILPSVSSNANLFIVQLDTGRKRLQIDMNLSPQEEVMPQSAVAISTIVVGNVIWWMVMIAAIGLGATHLSRCPVQPNVPIFLMVLGAASLLSLSLTYTRSTWKVGAVSLISSACTAFLYFFSLCWFIAGTIWVYSVYPPSYTPGEARYCHKTTFQFAFTVTTLTWVLLTLVFVCGSCFAVLTCCKTVRARRYLIPRRNTDYGGTICDILRGEDFLLQALFRDCCGNCWGPLTSLKSDAVLALANIHAAVTRAATRAATVA